MITPGQILGIMMFCGWLSYVPILGDLLLGPLDPPYVSVTHPA